jgi:hypothetical protein
VAQAIELSCGIPMNDQTPSAADAGELQFDQAEVAAPAAGLPVCTACRQAIPDHYFQVNGAILCERCSTAAKAHLTGGSSFGRFVKAFVYGFGAAVAGFALYFGVLKLTGMEIGLISIVVGFMVGAAVRKGSGGRGGALYQLTAVFLTYLAIAVSYSALVIPKMLDDLKAKKDAAAAQPENGADAGVDKAADGPPDAAPVAPKILTPIELVLGLVLICALMLALPIIAGFSQPIGLLIVAFALWEAFKLNKKVDVVITGPHSVGPASDRAPAHV